MGNTTDRRRVTPTARKRSEAVGGGGGWARLIRCTQRAAGGSGFEVVFLCRLVSFLLVWYSIMMKSRSILVNFSICSRRAWMVSKVWSGMVVSVGKRVER